MQETVHTFEVVRETLIAAPIDIVFDTILEEMGPLNQDPGGNPLPMKLEAWPGGRWYRDLGDDSGHMWGHVQAIKRPSLIEFSGPLFMSHPVANNVQYRLSEEPGGTLIKFRHSAFGLVQDDHRKGVGGGWGNTNSKIRERAERSK